MPEQQVPTHLKDAVELLDFIAGFLNGTGNAAVDGKVGVNDLPYFLPVLMQSNEAFTGIGQGLAALKNLTEEDRSLIFARFKTKFDVPQDQVESLVEDLLDIALRVGGIIVRFKAAFTKAA